MYDNETRSDVVVNGGDYLWGGQTSYVFTANTSLSGSASSRGFLVEDNFTFLLYDSLLASSIVGVVSLAVISGLEALSAQTQNDSSWVCLEDTASIVHVYAKTTADCPMNVMIVISALPSHGSLLRVNTSVALVSGDSLTTICASNLLCSSYVQYQPDVNVFTFPSSSWDGDPVGASSGMESFMFFAVAENGEYSQETVQEIQVINVNDPSGIECPAQKHVWAFGTSVYDGGKPFSPLDRIAVRGVSIVDPDEGVDIVKVSISTRYGLVSLNQDYLSLLDFSSVAYCYEDGVTRCSGSGVSDRELHFFATPAHAQLALDGLMYQSVASNVIDVINITILDGANGDCLSESKFLTDSIRNECWRVSCAFNISVQAHTADEEQLLSVDLPSPVWISAGVSISILFFGLCRRCSSCVVSGKTTGK